MNLFKTSVVLAFASIGLMLTSALGQTSQPKPAHHNVVQHKHYRVQIVAPKPKSQPHSKSRPYTLGGGFSGWVVEVGKTLVENGWTVICVSGNCSTTDPIASFVKNEYPPMPNVTFVANPSSTVIGQQFAFDITASTKAQPGLFTWEANCFDTVTFQFCLTPAYSQVTVAPKPTIRMKNFSPSLGQVIWSFRPPEGGGPFTLTMSGVDQKHKPVTVPIQSMNAVGKDYTIPMHCVSYTFGTYSSFSGSWTVQTNPYNGEIATSHPGINLVIPSTGLINSLLNVVPAGDVTAARSSVPAILNAANSLGVTDPNQIGYIFATSQIESDFGANMYETPEQPTSDPVSYFNNNYAGINGNGNAASGDGYAFRGRGYVQVTGRSNYSTWGTKLGVDLLTTPDLAADPNNAATILVQGMRDGNFSGPKLSDYFNSTTTDWTGARAIVNGNDRAETVGQRAQTYANALSGC